MLFNLKTLVVTFYRKKFVHKPLFSSVLAFSLDFFNIKLKYMHPTSYVLGYYVKYVIKNKKNNKKKQNQTFVESWVG